MPVTAQGLNNSSGPRLALGTAQWGTVYGIANSQGKPSTKEVERMLALARESGVCVLDTARAYGESEQVIGLLVGSDHFWTVVTKLPPDANSPDKALASLRASRAALRRDKLDAVLLHRWAHREAVWDILRRERDAERIGQFGASAGDPDEAWAILADPDVTVIQVAASLFDQRLSRTRFFDRAAMAGKVVFVRSVFLQGAAHLPPERLPPHLALLAEPASALRRWAADRGVSVAVPFFIFAASLPGVHVLIGCESLFQLTDNLRDWAVAKSLAGEVTALAATVPELPAHVLNPALWPKS